MNEHAIQPNKVGKRRRGWLMVKSAWRVFLLDKELALFPLISMIFGLMVLVFGAALTFATAPNYFDSNQASGSFSHWHWLIWAMTGLGIALVTTYTTAAVIAAALQRFRGNDPSIGSSVAVVRKRIGSLTMFGIFNFGVGQLLATLESKIPFFGGKILAFIADLAWGVANFFTIPVIVDSEDRIYPLPAMKKSVGTLKKVWAEGLVSQLSYGAVFVLIVILETIIFIPSIAIASHLVNGTGGGILAAFAAVIFLLLLLSTILVSSTIDGIIKAALYYYATTGEAPEHFNRELLHQAFTAKKARKIFGKPATF